MVSLFLAHFYKINNVMYVSNIKQLTSFQNCFGFAREGLTDVSAFQMSPRATQHFVSGKILFVGYGFSGPH